MDMRGTSQAVHTCFRILPSAFFFMYGTKAVTDVKSEGHE